MYTHDTINVHLFNNKCALIILQKCIYCIIIAHSLYYKCAFTVLKMCIYLVINAPGWVTLTLTLTLTLTQPLTLTIIGSSRRTPAAHAPTLTLTRFVFCLMPWPLSFVSCLILSYLVWVFLLHEIRYKASTRIRCARFVTSFRKKEAPDKIK